jgi:hypothetical protein
VGEDREESRIPHLNRAAGREKESDDPKRAAEVEVTVARGWVRGRGEGMTGGPLFRSGDGGWAQRQCLVAGGPARAHVGLRLVGIPRKHVSHALTQDTTDGTGTNAAATCPVTVSTSIE